jgi:hypothetical protein
MGVELEQQGGGARRRGRADSLLHGGDEIKRYDITDCAVHEPKLTKSQPKLWIRHFCSSPSGSIQTLAEREASFATSSNRMRKARTNIAALACSKN